MRRGLTFIETCKLVGVGYRTALRYLSKDLDYLKAWVDARLNGQMC